LTFIQLSIIISNTNTERERVSNNKQNKNNADLHFLLYCNVHTLHCDVTAQKHIGHANFGMQNRHANDSMIEYAMHA